MRNFETNEALAPLIEKLIEVKTLLDQLAPVVDGAIEACDTAIGNGQLDPTAGYSLLNARDGIQYALNSIGTDPLQSLLTASEQ